MHSALPTMPAVTSETLEHARAHTVLDEQTRREIRRRELERGLKATSASSIDLLREHLKLREELGEVVPGMRTHESKAATALQASIRGKNARLYAVRHKGLVERERAVKSVEAMGIAKSVTPEESLYLLMQVAKDVAWRLTLSAENPKLLRKLNKCIERCATAQDKHCRTFSDAEIYDQDGNAEEEALFEYLDALHQLEALIEQETGRPSGRSQRAVGNSKADDTSAEEMREFEADLHEYLAIAGEQAHNFTTMQHQLLDYRRKFEQMVASYSHYSSGDGGVALSAFPAPHAARSTIAALAPALISTPKSAPAFAPVRAIPRGLWPSLPTAAQ